MSTKTKTVELGKLPVYCGVWSSTFNNNRGYHKYNIVYFFGSCLISNIEGNTNVPATFTYDENNKLSSYVINPGWELFSNGYDSSIDCPIATDDVTKDSQYSLTSNGAFYALNNDAYLNIVIEIDQSEKTITLPQTDSTVSIVLNGFGTHISPSLAEHDIVLNFPIDYQTQHFVYDIVNDEFYFIPINKTDQKRKKDLYYIGTIRISEQGIKVYQLNCYRYKLNGVIQNNNVINDASLDSTELITSDGVFKNIENDAFIANSVYISTANRTITIPKNSLISCGGGGGTFTPESLQQDDVVLQFPNTFNLYYLTYDKNEDLFSVQQIGFSNTKKRGQNLYYIGTIRIYTNEVRVYNINALNYEIDGVKQIRSLSDKVEKDSSNLITSSGVYDSIDNKLYLLYDSNTLPTAVIFKQDDPEYNTYFGKLIIPKVSIRAYIVCSGLERSLNEDEASVLTGGDTEILFPKDYGSYRIFYNIETKSWSIKSLTQKDFTQKNEYYFGSIRINRSSFFVYELNSLGYIYNDKKYVNYLPETSFDSAIGTQCMYNPKIDLKKNDLKILDIGNSYTQDSLHYLKNILDSFGDSSTGYSLYSYVRAASSFLSVYNCYNDSDVIQYTISKVCGKDLSGVVTGTYDGSNGNAFRSTLQNVDWDLIIVHQVSTYANDYKTWTTNGSGGYLNEYLQILKETNPQATIGFYLIHSYTSNYVNNTEKSSLKRWKNISNSVKWIVSNYGIDFIIPYGTAIQSLRTKQSFYDANELSSDGTHLANGLGDYTAACVYYQSIFAPRFNKSITGNSFRIPDLSGTGEISVDSSTAELAWKSVINATYNWYNLLDMSNM